MRKKDSPLCYGPLYCDRVTDFFLPVKNFVHGRHLLGFGVGILREQTYFGHFAFRIHFFFTLAKPVLDIDHYIVCAITNSDFLKFSSVHDRSDSSLIEVL